ncbi:Fasciclin domain-containing protein 2 [Elsinoe fawcettii]|nr:Fasciclin domain-containing protein 2 [Elsinoe fawcettii]
MKASLYSFTLCIASAVAQQVPSLQAAIAATPNIATFGRLVNDNSAVRSLLSQQTNITILAPGNDAITRFLTTPEGQRFQREPDYATAVLAYHVLKGTVAAADFVRLADQAGGVRAYDSFLESGRFANVPGGQNVEVLADDDGVDVVSGLIRNGSVTAPDNRFQGGILHIIDTVLTVPPSISVTGAAANLQSLLSALQTAGIASAVEALPGITVFAPTNQAFSSISAATASLNAGQLANILQYHVVDGVVFSTDITNGQTVTTRAGQTLTFTITDDDIFVNGAKVVLPNVLVANGVVHTIDNVLNPANNTARPPQGATTGSIQFGAAAAGSGGEHPRPSNTYVNVPPATASTSPCPESTSRVATAPAPTTSAVSVTTVPIPSSTANAVPANSSSTTTITRASTIASTITTRLPGNGTATTRAPVVTFTGLAVQGAEVQKMSWVGAVVAIGMAAFL